METHSFTENGVDISNLDDYQTEELTKSKAFEVCLVSLLGMVSSLACFVWLDNSPQFNGAAPLYTGLLIAVFILFLVCGLIGFKLEAESDHKLPSPDYPIPPPDHITGLGAAVSILLVLFIGGAAYLGQVNYPDFIIPESAGQLAILALCIGFLLLVFATRISDLGPFYSLMNAIRVAAGPLDPVGRFLGRLDSWLVYIVAPLAGVGLKGFLARYMVLIGQIGSACAFSWFAPAPFGLIGTVWALVIAISVSRRWAWIEGDRSTKHQQPDLEQSQLKVGTTQDLRDEAIFSLLFLMLVLPLGMRQFHLSFPALPMFVVRENGAEDFLAWTSFFGVELLKALPFLDWADIYDAHGFTRVQVDGPAGMHVVFAARIVLDLVFLTALLQAVSISVSLAKHKREFLDRKSGVDFLDERIEQAEISKLAVLQGDTWTFRPELDKFVHYSPKHLGRLNRFVRTHHRPRLEAAVKEIIRRANLQFSPAGEQLVDVAREKKPLAADLRAAIKLLVDEKEFDLGYLRTARLVLRQKGGLETERTQIAQLIRNHIKPSREREQVFAEMLAGPEQDTLASVRLIAVEALTRNYRQFLQGLDALKDAALHDRSNGVKRRAESFLNSIVSEQRSQVRSPAKSARST
ncbi:MAG: hypothetical protein NW202_06850 [Nitrospira sp.]|nr:hypothetical protein [Nitrospira sp.]